MPDYARLNTERLGSYQQFDFRVDKKYNLRRVTIDLFLDLQNAFLIKNPSVPNYTFQRTPDNSAFVTTDGQPIRPNGANAVPVLLADDDATVLPTIGFIVEF